MKIAVFHNLPSGGAKRALYGLVDYLTKNSNIVDVFVPSTANEDFLPLKDIVNNLTVFKVKSTLSGSLYSTFKYAPPIVKKISLRDLENTERIIAASINDDDYDVVLSEQDQFTLSPFFLKYIEKPTAYYCPQPTRDEAVLKRIIESTSTPNRFKQFIYDYADKNDLKIDRTNASYAKYILTNSYFSRENILRMYGFNSYVSYLGIDNELFTPMEALKEDMVLSVGTVTPTKGYDFIIKSLAKIDEGIRPEFIIIANYSEVEWKNYIISLADELGVELRILDLVDDDKLTELYNKAKIVLYAPYLEPFGLVPLEAMSCGTPVIGVREGGVRESVIHNKTGLLTERDEDLFADAIIKLLRDGEKRSEMSKDARVIIDNFWTLKHAGERLFWHLKRAV